VYYDKRIYDTQFKTAGTGDNGVTSFVSLQSGLHMVEASAHFLCHWWLSMNLASEEWPWLWTGHCDSVIMNH